MDPGPYNKNYGNCMDTISISKELEDGQEKNGTLLRWHYSIWGQPMALLVKAAQRKKLPGKGIANARIPIILSKGRTNLDSSFQVSVPLGKPRYQLQFSNIFKYLVEGAEYLSYK